MLNPKLRYKAKLRFSEEVDQNDVDEALRLMEISQASVNDTMEEEEISKSRSPTLSLTEYRKAKD